MILDLEGATTEPSRRRHVAMVSASVAAAALLLLYALLIPTPPTGTPSTASAAPSPVTMTVHFASDSQSWTRGGPFDESLRDAGTSTLCAAGVGSSQTVHLVVDSNGRPVAAYTTGTTGRFIPLPRVYVGSGWLTVPCDTSDVFAPRLNRAR
jgi:hypothetical protein